MSNRREKSEVKRRLVYELTELVYASWNARGGRQQDKEELQRSLQRMTINGLQWLTYFVTKRGVA